MSVRSRVESVVGRTRRARIITAATVLAAAAAVIAFIAIDANDDSSGAASENAYQGQADRICVDGKQKLVAAGRRSFNGSTPNSFASYAASAREISDQTRSELAKLEPSEDLRRQADALDASLRGLDPPLDQLERAARAQDTQRIEAAVGVVQAASQRSDNAVDALGLQACARLKVGLLRVEPR